MKTFAINNIYIRNISLLICSGLILAFNSNPTLISANKKTKQGKVKLLKTPVKERSKPFSFYNDVVTPLLPALKI